MACRIPLSASYAGPPRGCMFGVDENCIVRADGSVGPCCALFFEAPLRYGGVSGSPADAARFGNALQEDFRTIWSSARYVAFRNALRQGESPGVCRACLAHYGIG